MISPQPDLFDAAPRGVPYQKRSATSRDAADRVRPHVTNHESLVYDAIVAAGAHGKTRKELSHELAFAEHQQNRITGRVQSLIEKGLVRERHEVEGSGAAARFVKPRRDGSVILVAVERVA